MSVWRSTVRHEVAATCRERLPQLVLSVFVAMTGAAAFIGSSAKETVSGVYREAAAQALTTAANPFDGVSPLYYARNNVIYIILIGALLAIVTGVQSTIRDRRAQTIDLVLSRDVRPVSYLGAKLSGIALMLAGLLVLTAFLSFAGIGAVTGTVPTPGESLRLLGLYGLAWLFLMAFVTFGMISGIRAAGATPALLMPIVAWSIIVFILPLAGTAALPVSLLNPVPAPVVAPEGFFALSSTVTGPLSLGEQFKHAALLLLQDPAATGTITAPLLTILAVLTGGCVVLLATSRHRLRSPIHA
ncbi:ABC transporter permease subunit [Arthrobacter sp. KFRI-F3372]|uniref:ABC transporter permease subunit n=1 Tax=Micrococcaceae TaxID=1268 RepID=UPI00278999FB|nr:MULTISPECIES: ABC transporter permease subunit [Micrococcaceae]MDP9989210.1 ABC-2 type transport system permease protein [Arthrobacter oryzae]MEE2523908.1 ABC transporter permease subunit [Pseudarthrobacter sp. J47]MEE2530337.1 ABC transporter permease subunit [Pseudarthrobacter sp. J75]WHP61096.1 ABC transporter permease subunit [Arthrobacter sp. KFRI-F3372]